MCVLLLWRNFNHGKHGSLGSGEWEPRILRIAFGVAFVLEMFELRIRKTTNGELGYVGIFGE